MKNNSLDNLTREHLIEVITSMNTVYRTHQIHIIKEYLTEENYKKNLESDVVKRNLEIGSLCWQHSIEKHLEKIKKYNEDRMNNFNKTLESKQESIDSEIAKVVNDDFFDMLEESKPMKVLEKDNKFITTAELRDLENQVEQEDITYSRMVELLNEKANNWLKQQLIKK